MNEKQFEEFTARIAAETGLSIEEAGDIAAKIGDTPVVHGDKIRVSHKGKALDLPVSILSE